MKIKIYTLSTDTDNGNTEALFTSEAERDARAWAFIDSYAPGNTLRERHDNPGDAWAELQDKDASIMDHMGLDSHEIEVLTLDNASLAPHLAALLEQVKATSAWDDALEGEDKDMFDVVNDAEMALQGHYKVQAPAGVNAELLAAAKCAISWAEQTGIADTDPPEYMELQAAIAAAEAGQVETPTEPTLEVKSECDCCGELVSEIIGCPDGKEICQSCFDNGEG